MARLHVILTSCRAVVKIFEVFLDPSGFALVPNEGASKRPPRSALASRILRPAASDLRPCFSVPSAARSCHGVGGLPKTPGTKRPEWMPGDRDAAARYRPGPAALHNRLPSRTRPDGLPDRRKAGNTPRLQSRLPNYSSICPSVTNTESCPASARRFPHDLCKTDPQNRDASLSSQGRRLPCRAPPLLDSATLAQDRAGPACPIQNRRGRPPCRPEQSGIAPVHEGRPPCRHTRTTGTTTAWGAGAGRQARLRRCN